MANFTPKEIKIFNAIKELSERLAEDRLYEVVAEEIDRKDYDPVSKLKALEEARGDEQVAKSVYAKHRVRRLKDLSAEFELIAAAKAAEAAAAKKEAEEKMWVDPETERLRNKL